MSVKITCDVEEKKAGRRPLQLVLPTDVSEGRLRSAGNGSYPLQYARPFPILLWRVWSRVLLLYAGSSCSSRGSCLKYTRPHYQNADVAPEVQEE